MRNQSDVYSIYDLTDHVPSLTNYNDTLQEEFTKECSIYRVRKQSRE